MDGHTEIVKYLVDSRAALDLKKKKKQNKTKTKNRQTRHKMPFHDKGMRYTIIYIHCFTISRLTQLLIRYIRLHDQTNNTLNKRSRISEKLYLWHHLILLVHCTVTAKAYYTSLRYFTHIVDFTCHSVKIPHVILPNLCYILLSVQNGKSALQGKNAVCALQINCKLLPFSLEKSCRNKQTINFLL